MLCVSIKILSHDSAKNKTETAEGFKFCTFLVVFKWHHGNEEVKQEKKIQEKIKDTINGYRLINKLAA